jgi:hypothetical protein
MSRRTKFAIGDRIVLNKEHTYPAAHGRIAGSKGTLFYGWTVLLDNGRLVGAGERHLTKESGASGE